MVHSTAKGPKNSVYTPEEIQQLYNINSNQNSYRIMDIDSGERFPNDTSVATDNHISFQGTDTNRDKTRHLHQLEEFNGFNHLNFSPR